MNSENVSLVNRESLGWRSLPGELRALWAVFKREWIIFLRYPSWIVALFVWPILFPAVYILGARALAGPDGSGLTRFMQVAGTQNFIGYIAIGTTIWMWQNIVLWSVGLTLRNEQMRGTLETNWLSPVWRFSFLLGSSGTQLVSMGIFLLASALEFALIFGLRLNGSPWLLLLVMLAGIPSIYGLAFTFASLVITVKEANSFVYLVRGLVMVFCGITFPVALLPGWMQGVSRWLPQTYLIQGARLAALEGAGLAELRPVLASLVVFGLFWLCLGYLIFMWMERRARKTGAIGQY